MDMINRTVFIFGSGATINMEEATEVEKIKAKYPWVPKIKPYNKTKCRFTLLVFSTHTPYDEPHEQACNNFDYQTTDLPYTPLTYIIFICRNKSEIASFSKLIEKSIECVQVSKTNRVVKNT